MRNLARIVLSLSIVITAVVVLCLYVPNSFLFKGFLTLVGGLLVLGAGSLLMKEISKLSDLKHRQKVQQELRELELQKRKQEHFFSAIHRQRISRGRYPRF